MDFNILELFLDATLPVKIILVILLLASVLSWIIIFEKFFTFQKALASSHAIEDRYWHGEALEDLYSEIKQKEIVDLEVSELVLITIFEELNKKNSKTLNQIESCERLVRVIINRDEERLSQRLSLLATISSSTPYIGLLGTVIGIINAFSGLSSTAQLTLSSVAPGISEALIATAAGLLAAIPALIAYNQFTKQLNNILNGSLAFAEELLAQTEKINAS